MKQLVVLMTLIVLAELSSLVDAARPASTKAQCVAECNDAITQTCASITKHRKFKRCRAKLISQCKRFGTAKMCPPPTTTTTTSTSTTSTTLGSTSSCSMQWCDRGATVYDTATGLEWEKKTTQVGSGVNPADLHDVDNAYRWSGRCHSNYDKRCQPNQAAEDTCDAYTELPDRDYGCQQCIGNEGPCDMDIPGYNTAPNRPAPSGVTTIWDWLNQLNASNYAGHNDWRLPSLAGCNEPACSGPNVTFDGNCDGRGSNANGPCPVHE